MANIIINPTILHLNAKINKVVDTAMSQNSPHASSQSVTNGRADILQ